MNLQHLQQDLHIWQGRLGLAQWDIEIQVVDAEPDGEPIDEHTWMRTLRHAAYQRGVITVASHLLEPGPAPPASWHDVTVTDARISTILVHELLHCWAAPLADVVDACEDLVGQAAWQVLAAGRDRAEEHLVDTLARALVDAFDRQAPTS